MVEIKDKIEKQPQEPVEMDFLIIANKIGVKEELIKEDIWNMRLEGWLDKEGKEKINSWVVEKKEFSDKNLFQNKTLASAISGERSKMVVLKVREEDEKTKNTLQKLQGINITSTLLEDKNFVKEYQGYEAWLLERGVVEKALIWDDKPSTQALLDQKYFDKENTTEIFLGYNENEELTGELVIKDFPNLEEVNIENSFTNYFNNKRIKKLKIINCPKLKKLNCRFHELTELDTSELPNLTHLDCQVNKIKKLDLSKNIQLCRLVCANNHLTELDLSKNAYLNELFCYKNQLTNLDVSGNENLTWLECFLNSLKTSDIKISEKISYFGAFPLVFLARQGESSFLTAKKKEWTKLIVDYERKYYEMERINISDLNKLVGELNLKSIENQEFMSKFISPILAKAVAKERIYCLSLRIILDNLANQLKYRCLVFRNRLCEGENKEYEEKLKGLSLDWQKCGFMKPKHYLPSGGIESLVDRFTHQYIEGGEELRKKVGSLWFVKND